MLEAWHIWLMLAAALALAEISGAHFVFLALSGACLAGAGVAAWTDADFNGQFGVAVVAAAVLTPFFVWAYRRYLATGRGGAAEVDWASGRISEVCEIRGRQGIYLNGAFYPVQAAGGESLKKGQRVLVEGVEGLLAWVVPLDDPEDNASPSAGDFSGDTEKS